MNYELRISFHYYFGVFLSDGNSQALIDDNMQLGHVIVVSPKKSHVDLYDLAFVDPKDTPIFSWARVAL